jgi:hypothetical protein
MSEETTQAAVKITPPRADQRCKVEGCKRPYRAKLYCNVHYRLWRHGELPKGRYKICTKEACRKPREGQGSLCAEHKSGAAT